MKILWFTIAIAALILTISCGTSSSDYSGSWQRVISDPEIGVTGDELLVLSPDSLLSIDNRMYMAYSDSNFSYTTEFVTSIKGRWSVTDKNILANLDISTYTFDTVPGKTRLDPIRSGATHCDEGALSKMQSEILGSLNEMYRDIYTNNPVLEISHPEVVNDTILAGICGNSSISWLRVCSDLTDY